MTIATYKFPQADQQLFFFLSPLPLPDRGPENTERYCRLQLQKFKTYFLHLRT